MLLRTSKGIGCKPGDSHRFIFLISLRSEPSAHYMASRISVAIVEVDGQSTHSLPQKKYADIGFRVRDIAEIEDENNYAPCCILCKTQSARDHFAGWLRYRCEQQLATEAHGNRTNVMRRVTSDL
jgi:ribosomal protein L37AE/L43A